MFRTITIGRLRCIVKAGELFGSSPTLPFLLNVYGLGTTSPESCEKGKENDEEDELVTKIKKIKMYKHEFQFREKAKDHRRQEIMIDVRLLEFTYSRFGFG